MKPNAKIMSILMIATMLLGIAAIFPAKAVPIAGTVFVDPANNIFPPPPMGVGSTFMVNVSISNTTEFVGVAWHLTWDPTLLKVDSITEVLFHTVTPPAFWGNIWSINLKFDNTLGTADYAQTFQDSAAALAGGYSPVNVTGTIATASLIFEILQAAPFHGSVSCPLTLSDVGVSDVAANPIPVTVVNGLYQLNWAPLNTFPYFSVLPATYTASSVGQIFNISICVNDLDPGWAAVGFEFKLGYNATILQLLNVFNGTWLTPFGAPPNQGTQLLTAFGANYVQVGDLVLPDVNGTWHAPFPSAPNPNTAPLVILQFQATMQGLFPTVLSSALHLYDVMVADYLAGSVNTTASVDGFYSMTPLVLGRSIDVFVGQDGVPYPAPFGGQGPNAPADMFWPQKDVTLFANVTYNQWPEQMKDVAFQIIDPHGVTWGIIYARTDANGVATTSFRLPWPCDNPEQFIGTWTVIATVDVACNIVNDTVQFHYDYLVRIWKVTVDPTSIGHNGTVTATIDYGSHSQQDRNVTLTVTGLDETGVPFAFVFKQVTIGGAIFCQPKNYTDTVQLYIPKWARAGQGEVDTAFLDNWPFMGGTVQSGFFTGTQWQGFAATPLTILAAWA